MTPMELVEVVAITLALFGIHQAWHAAMQSKQAAMEAHRVLDLLVRAMDSAGLAKVSLDDSGRIQGVKLPGKAPPTV